MPVIYHKNMIPIEDNALLWRYMNLDKFESLLKEKALFFCRADKFSDPFEGSVPIKEAIYRDSKSNNKLGYLHTHLEMKMFTVVNCWHINNVESDAMWQLYLKSNEGVAIQTTYKKLYNSFSLTPENILISKIRYLDYDNGTWYHPTDYPHRSYNFYVPLIHKRQEFIHENECRVFHEIPHSEQKENYWDEQRNQIGKLVSIDVNVLIDKLILPPTADEKVKDKITLMLIKYGFDFTINQSNLSKEPIY